MLGKHLPELHPNKCTDDLFQLFLVYAWFLKIPCYFLNYFIIIVGCHACGARDRGQLLGTASLLPPVCGLGMELRSPGLYIKHLYPLSYVTDSRFCYFVCDFLFHRRKSVF